MKGIRAAVSGAFDSLARVALRSGWLPILLLAIHPHASAQASAAELQVVRAALPHLRAGLPLGEAALDPEPFCETRLIGWDCPAALEEAAASHGFRLSGSAFTLVCLGDPASCRLVNTGSLVVLSPPDLSRDRATVEARVWSRAGDRSRPLVRRRVRLTLARGPDGWEVVREESLPTG